LLHLQQNLKVGEKNDDASDHLFKVDANFE